MLSIRNAARTRAAIAGMLLVLLAACATDTTTLKSQRVAVDAKPNGIAVRPGDGMVFLTDDTTGSILSSADAHTFTPYAAIPAGGAAGNSLSQLSFADARTLLIERFGFGTSSALLAVNAPNAVTVLAGPDPARRRLGLAIVAPGQALSTWFVKDGNQPARGGLSLLTYNLAAGTATERDLLSGLGKPVGVAIAGNTVFVSDQANHAIVSAPLDALLASTQPSAQHHVVARVESPDLLAADSNGTLYTKCNSTDFCRISSDGTAFVIASDFHDARGVAIDTARHRLYVVDRAASGGPSYVHILSLP
ncbi:DNA-binding beta-propeller fold protein YncE [Paraburkholderia sp. GAS199]|uniref:hypothetical protein n=1 Tax=Paraburkholderia sp. GAS199 TaxID=3035126 RepID=UPI003D25B87A